MPEAGQSRIRLRALRTERGWTQQDVADRLIRLAWLGKPRKNVGCSADMVAKWESGRKGISPLYRELLAKLYGVSVAQLDIDRDASPSPLADDTDRSLVTFLDTAASLLDQLGSAGAVLAPQIFALWKDEVANRRAMFALLDPLTQTQLAPAPGPLDLDAVDQLASTYERLYDTADPAALLTPAAAHVRMLGDVISATRERGDRQRLLRNRARVATLAGRIAFVRLGNAMSARAFFSVALDDARELQDGGLSAIVLAHAADVAAAEGHLTAARDSIELAFNLVPPGGPVSQWLKSLNHGQLTSATDSKWPLAR